MIYRKRLFCQRDPQFLAFVILTNSKRRFRAEVRSTPEDMVEKYGREMVFLTATQGHSRRFASLVNSTLGTGLEVRSLEDAPAFAVHATRFTTAMQILNDDKLYAMQRTHIHFAISVPGDLSQANTVNNLLRGKVLIFLDLKKIFDHRIPFLVTSNNVGLVKAPNGLKVSQFVLDMVDRHHDYSLMRETTEDMHPVVTHFMTLLRESEKQCQQDFMSKHELVEITDIDDTELPTKAGADQPPTAREQEDAINKGYDHIAVKKYTQAKQELPPIAEEPSSLHGVAPATISEPLQPVKTEELPDFGDDETEVQDEPMNTPEDPPEEVKQEVPDNPASAVVDLDMMDISSGEEDYSMISSQYSMVSAAPEVMSLVSEDSALNTDVLKSRYELLLDEGWEPIWQCGHFQGLAKETANGN